MKLKPFLLLLAALSVSLPSMALKEDTNQPINIDSGSQSIDMEKNIVTFSDNVVITQGSIRVHAANVTIIRQEGKREIIDAKGAPVTFQQTLDDGKVVSGKAASVHYDLGSEFLTLTGNAELKQQDSLIQAQTITYDVKKQQLKAGQSSKNGRVKTVLIPAQLQQK